MQNNYTYNFSRCYAVMLLCCYVSLQKYTVYTADR